MSARAGYVRIYRTIWDHPALRAGRMTEREAWIWLVAHAAWQDSDGLQRGQLRASLRELCEAWQWETRSEVRACLARWQRAGMVARAGSVLSVLRYDDHQAVQRTASAQRAHSQRTASAQQNAATAQGYSAPAHSQRTASAQPAHSQRTSGKSDCFDLNEVNNKDISNNAPASARARAREELEPDLSTKAGRRRAYPARPETYPAWFNAAWSARTGRRSGDSKRGAWQLVRRAVIEGEITGQQVQERTEAYAAEAGDPAYKLGWRRWFGEVLTDWQPSCDGAPTTTADQPRGPRGPAAPTTERDHAIRPPEEWTAADLRDPYAST